MTFSTARLLAWSVWRVHKLGCRHPRHEWKGNSPSLLLLAFCPVLISGVWKDLEVWFWAQYGSYSECKASRASPNPFWKAQEDPVLCLSVCHSVSDPHVSGLGVAHPEPLSSGQFEPLWTESWPKEPSWKNQKVKNLKLDIVHARRWRVNAHFPQKQIHLLRILIFLNTQKKHTTKCFSPDAPLSNP